MIILIIEDNNTKEKCDFCDEEPPVIRVFDEFGSDTYISLCESCRVKNGYSHIFETAQGKN